MKIHFLGTGNAQAGRSRQNTSLLLSAESRYVLVDCSGTPSQGLARKSIPAIDVNDIVLTHAHVDHIYALPSLLHNIWLTSYATGGAGVRIHGNSETLAVANNLIDAFGLREKPSAIKVEMIALDESPAKLKIEFGDWVIESFDVNHGVPTIGLQIDNGRDRVIFSADSTVCEAIANRINGARLLIHDCCGMDSGPGHAGAREIGSMIRNSHCELVYLSHLPEMSIEELQEIVNEVQTGFGGKVVISQDGDIVEI